MSEGNRQGERDPAKVKGPRWTPGRWKSLIELTFGGLSMGFLAAMPNEAWSPAWGNFFGATFVAVGGLLASMYTYKLVPEKVVPFSWASIVIGSFVIAGASLQMALAPVPL